MKLIQVNPRPENKQTLLSTLNNKERSLRGKGTSFYKDSKTKWKHVKFNGWVTVSDATTGILFAKVQSKIPTGEAKLFEAFIGYLTRHCGQLIDSVIIYYK